MSRAGRKPPPPRMQADALPKELSRQLIRWLFGTSTWAEAAATTDPLQNQSFFQFLLDRIHTSD
jgi:hypothetical protein